VLSLLHISQLLDPADLRITYKDPVSAEENEDEPPVKVTKAYWTLYIDTLVMSLDGNAFDAIWGTVVAALSDTTLPAAHWDADHETVVCSPTIADAKALKLNGLPIASTFAVFDTLDPQRSTGRTKAGAERDGEEADYWVLADPDALEEELCGETVTVVVTPSKGGSGGVLRLEKTGGGVVGKRMMKDLVKSAEDRWSDWDAALTRKGG